MGGGENMRQYSATAGQVCKEYAIGKLDADAIGGDLVPNCEAIQDLKE